MEKLSEFTERVVSEVCAPSFNERERARGLIKEIGGHSWDGKGEMIDRVYDAVRRFYPTATWTKRRIRSFWHREAARIGWREMRELEVVAESTKLDREVFEQARKEHAEFIARSARMATALAVQDEEFHREQVEAFRRIAGHGHDRGVATAQSGRDEAACPGTRSGPVMDARDYR